MHPYPTWQVVKVSRNVKNEAACQGTPEKEMMMTAITDIPLIKYTACKGKPMIISTGIADAGDIQLAVDACRLTGNNDITLLQCTSSYPAPVELANLRVIPSLAETFGVKSGLPDHTAGSIVAIERHAAWPQPLVRGSENLQSNLWYLQG